MRATSFSVMRRYRDDLQTMPWITLAGYGLLIVFYGLLISFLLPAAWQGVFMRILLVTPLTLIVAKDLACFPLSVARVKSAKARGAAWPLFLWALAPPEFLSYMRLDGAMWRGVFNWLLRRQHPSQPTGTPFGYLERGSYDTVICLVLVALIVEMPVDVLIASVMAKTPEQRHMLHLIFGLIAAYSLVWVLADRWHVLGRRHHILTETSLELDIGARGFGSIPLDAIAGCERLDESPQSWCMRNAYALHATRKLTPFDAPNLVLLLKPGCDVQLCLLQQKRGGDGPIFLYLDRPELLIAGIAERGTHCLPGGVATCVPAEAR